jgi:hypothetical protein
LEINQFLRPPPPPPLLQEGRGRSDSFCFPASENRNRNPDCDYDFRLLGNKNEILSTRGKRTLQPRTQKKGQDRTPPQIEDAPRIAHPVCPKKCTYTIADRLFACIFRKKTQTLTVVESTNYPIALAQSCSKSKAIRRPSCNHAGMMARPTLFPMFLSLLEHPGSTLSTSPVSAGEKKFYLLYFWSFF